MVWILEDDKNFAFLLRTALARLHDKVEVRLFETGEAALQSVGAPDIVIADTHLAGPMTGPEVVTALRYRNPELMVIFSSSFGKPAGDVFGPKDRDLPRPFSMSALVRQVSEMLPEIRRLQMPPPPRQPPARGQDRI